MPPIPFPLSSAPGVKGQESGGRLINAYAEKTGEGARFPIVWHRVPGCNKIAEQTSYIHLRGAFLVSANLLLVFNTRAMKLNESSGVFTITDLGALSGTLPVTIAKNNAATPNIVCVTENGCFNLFMASAPTAFADDEDLPVPNSVSFLDGYFLWTIGDGRIFASDLNAVTVNSLSFTTEQGLTLMRGVAHRGEFYALGKEWTGVYRNAATSPFPLERRFTIPFGLVGTHAISGWEDGWVNELLWVSENNTVIKLGSGYTPERVSTHDVDQAIENTVDKSLLEASVYMGDRGHAFWTLTNPEEWTWEYNLTTGNWHERMSYGMSDWSGRRSIRAFDRWITGHDDSGALFEIRDDYAKEGDLPLVWRVQSGATANFPARFSSPRADFDFSAAVGIAAGDDPIQTNPRVAARWSVDGGYSWKAPVLRALGQQGVGGKLVSILNLGMAKGKGFRFELSISDPVHVGFSGGQIAIDQRAP